MFTVDQKQDFVAAQITRCINLPEGSPNGDNLAHRKIRVFVLEMGEDTGRQQRIIHC